MTVLLTDDEPNIRKMMRLMLQSGGFQVLEAANGDEALALAEKHAFDVLVTDVVLEGMSGSALARSLQERHPDLPILFVSGHPMDFGAEPQEYRRCAFLPKPFQKGQLLEAVRGLTEPAA
jgi:CheY-like chemotaxis protein